MTTKTSTLAADALKEDPRIEQAKQLLKETLADHQSQITKVRAPDETLKADYKTALAELAEARGGGLWYPYIGSGLGNGPLVELCDGSVKYDMICGIGVHYLGHSHPKLVEAAFDAALQDLPLQGHLQQNRDQAELCQNLVAAAPGMDHCFLTTSGVMANENALKIIFQKNFPAPRILAFEKCFAGRTLAAAQITDKAAYRDGLPTALDVDFVPFFDSEDPKGSTERAVSSLHHHLQRYPKQHAAFIMELVQGEGGFYPGDRNFFLALINVLKEHEIAVLVDEIQSFGRTPNLFAYEYFGLEDHVDIVTIGKLAQVCATLYKKELKPRPGLLSQTFTSSTAAIRCASAVLKELLNGGYYGDEGKVVRFHTYLKDKLESISKERPGEVSGPYGIGAMFAFTPFEGEADATKKLTHNLFEAGVICFICGSDPTRIRFLLPMGALTEDHLDEVVEIVKSCLKSISK